MKTVALLFASAMALSSPGHACDLALSLALDVSASIKPEQQQAIRIGTAAALTNHEVLQSFVGSSVYIEVFEWADRHRELVAWRQVANADDMADLATAIVNAPTPGVGSSTQMSQAMMFAHDQFAKLHCDRSVLDVMTDGQPDEGIGIAGTRDALFDEGEHEINVLFLGENPVALKTMNDAVKFGYSGFVQPVATVEDYEHAMLRKLLREISMNVPPRSEG